MPLQRISQGFKDISMTFQSNPLTKDLIVLKNENAIARSIKNIVFTNPGEKPFQPNFGSRITESLFENIDDITALEIESELKESIQRQEPRVSLTELKVTPDTIYLQNHLLVDILNFFYHKLIRNLQKYQNMILLVFYMQQMRSS